MVWHGMLTVLGDESSAMISGVAGLRHMLITVGMIVLFIALRRATIGSSKEPTQAMET
ncbi:DUF2871 family protein [Rothia sp. p3-SID1597]|nr:DUF2871 family protein [Rothia sp. p3-SID1597]